MEDPDHKASLDLRELKALVQAVRDIEIALGYGIQRPSLSDLKIGILFEKVLLRREIFKEEKRFPKQMLQQKDPARRLPLYAEMI